MKLCGAARLFPLLSMAFLLISAALAAVIFWAWNRTINYSYEAIDTSSKKTETSMSQMVNVQAEMFRIFSTSASNLEKILATSVEGNWHSFHTIQKKVVPALFLAYSTVPYVSQASYIGNNGMLFSYYKDSNQTRAIFSNSSWHENKLHDDHLSKYHWYGGSVDEFTGILLGYHVDLSQLLPFHLDWMHEALGHKGASVLMEPSLADGGKPYFLFTASITWNNSSFHHSPGIISLGVSTDEFVNYCAQSIYSSNARIYLATEDGKVLARRDLSFPYSAHVDVPIIPNCTYEVDGHLDVNGTSYTMRCTPINVTGDPLLVFVTLLPYKEGTVDRIREMGLITPIVLAVMVMMVVSVNCSICHLARRYQKTASFLRAALINCREDIRQAERKSMKKSLAFASATHDIRTSLAGITGLIEACRSLISPDLVFNRYLQQMDACASKLLGIVNSVLDIGKVEAGKMQLEEVSFDMAQVVEESIDDVFRIVALKKGLELVWDPCDLSVLKHSTVQGDRRRLKQILDSLLGNAVKFTARGGHVILRAWAKKANSQIPTTSDHGCQVSNMWWRRRSPLLQVLEQKEDAILSSESSCHPNNAPSCAEFIFEVDDSGIGIPKEKREYVFENYVQVKDSTRRGGGGGDEMGTGLGLGVVQSLVRLMGGEINILDKDVNDKGTCFRFNVVLRRREPSTDKSSSHNRWLLEEQLRNLTVVHFIQGVESRKVLQRWMEDFGAKVWEADTAEVLEFSLQKIKDDGLANYGATSASREEDVQGGSMPIEHGSEHNLSLKRTSSKVSSTRILIIVDVAYRPLLESSSIVNNLCEGANKHRILKIVWLRDFDSPLDELRLKDVMNLPLDLLLDKPLHGSRIFKVLALAREFKAVVPWEEENKTMSPSFTGPLPRGTSHRGAESTDPSAAGKPLTGWNILLVEDHHILQHLALKMISNLGAIVQPAENGEVALNIVKQALKQLALDGKANNVGTTTRTSRSNFLYDIILMDCEMPKMNGYEAARQIRIEEKQYGIHIPIIALSAHETYEKRVKSGEAGMDFHVTKPLTKQLLLDVIRRTNIAKNT